MLPQAVKAAVSKAKAEHDQQTAAPFRKAKQGIAAVPAEREQQHQLAQAKAQAHTKAQQQPAAPDESADESERQCWICFESSGALVAPCRCKGSVQFVHQKCLKEWLKTSANTVALPEPENAQGFTFNCPQCKFAYRFATSAADSPRKGRAAQAPSSNADDPGDGAQNDDGDGGDDDDAAQRHFDPWPADRLFPSWRMLLPSQRAQAPPRFAVGLAWDLVRSWYMLLPHLLILFSYLSLWGQYGLLLLTSTSRRGPDVVIRPEHLGKLLADLAPSLFPLPAVPELAPFVDARWSAL